MCCAMYGITRVSRGVRPHGRRSGQFAAGAPCAGGDQGRSGCIGTGGTAGSFATAHASRGQGRARASSRGTKARERGTSPAQADKTGRGGSQVVSVLASANAGHEQRQETAIGHGAADLLASWLVKR